MKVISILPFRALLFIARITGITLVLVCLQWLKSKQFCKNANSEIYMLKKIINLMLHNASEKDMWKGYLGIYHFLLENLGESKKIKKLPCRCLLSLSLYLRTFHHATIKTTKYFFEMVPLWREFYYCFFFCEFTRSLILNFE